MEFPRLVYKSAAEHCLAATVTEFKLLIAAGWFDSVPDAIEKRPVIISEINNEQPSTTKKTRAATTWMKDN